MTHMISRASHQYRRWLGGPSWSSRPWGASWFTASGTYSWWCKNLVDIINWKYLGPSTASWGCLSYGTCTLVNLQSNNFSMYCFTRVRSARYSETPRGVLSVVPPVHVASHSPSSWTVFALENFAPLKFVQASEPNHVVTLSECKAV